MITTRFKNYVIKPRPSGYRTYQWTFMQAFYSSDKPGADYEVQVRDWDMHRHATSTHREYKNLSKPEFEGLDLELLASVFHIDNFDKVNIVGFVKYNTHDFPIQPQDVYLAMPKEITDIDDAYGFAIPLVLESFTT